MKLADAMAIINSAKFEFLTEQTAKDYDVYVEDGEIEAKIVMIADLGDTFLIFDLKERSVQSLTVNEACADAEFVVHLDGNLPNFGIEA